MLAIAFTGGVVIERIVIRPVENAPVLTIVIVTLGLALLLNGLMSLIWGGANVQFHGPFSTRTIDVGGVPVSVQDIGIVAVSIVLVGLLALFFRFTKLGLGDARCGRSTRIRRGSSAYASAGCSRSAGVSPTVLGAVAGMMIAPVVFLDPNMMQTILLYAFAAAVLGGLDSPVGAVVGGILLGVTITLLGRYVGFIGSTLKLPAALLLILVLLLVRPGGLFGKVAVRRV